MTASAEFKERWNLFVQGAAVIVTAAGAFLIPPPGGLGETETVVKNFGPFLIAGILALWFVPAARWRSKQYTWRWWLAAFVLLPLSIALVFAYARLFDKWSVPYPPGSNQRVIIGSTLLPDGKQWRDSLITAKAPYSVEEHVMDEAGDVTRIWPAAEIAWREQRLALLYLLALALIGSFMVTAIQATFCQTSNTTPARKGENDAHPADGGSSAVRAEHTSAPAELR